MVQLVIILFTATL